jgi:TRAP-type C4-dicarboxylate transport system permease small subunit
MVEDLALLLACASLFVIMVIQAVDVTLRYCFNFPLQWSYGLISHYLLVAAFFLAMPYTCRVGGHVNVDVVVRTLARPLQGALHLLTLLLSLLLFSIIVYEGAILTGKSWSGTEIMPDFYNWPSWTSNVFVPVGIALVEARIAIQFWKRLLRIAVEAPAFPFFLPKE